jgi:hypothetical protein
VVLAVLYAPLSIVAYTSQYLLVPRLAQIDPDQAAVWYLANEASFTLGLDLFAYFTWGSAAVLIALRLRRGAGLLRTAAAILALSGVTSILAYPLHVSSSDIGGVLSAFSGGLSVVAAITVVAHVIWARPSPTWWSVLQENAHRHLTLRLIFSRATAHRPHEKCLHIGRVKVLVEEFVGWIVPQGKMSVFSRKLSE